MVYFEHATTPVIFGFLTVFYYFSIPLAFIAWYWQNYAYIKKRNFKLKRLLAYLMIAFLVTSLAAYKMASIYFYIHSPAEGEFCMSASCIAASPILERYGVNTDSLKELGMPSFGPMAVYRVYDTGTNATVPLPVRMDYVVVVRPLLVLPASQVDVYYLDGGDVRYKDTFYIVWPKSPGNVLTKNLDVKFTVLVVTGAKVNAP
jgi:hypothetical protein